MALSSGYRALIGELGAWIAVACIGAAAVMNIGEIRAIIAGAAPVASETDAQQAGSDDADQRPRPSVAGAQVELKAGHNGHFIAEARINGRPVPVMVDTGASMVALSWDDAERAGILVKPQDFTARVRTANGIAKVAPVRLASVAIGDVMVRDVQAVVSERGAMNSTLLGMTFLGRLHKVEMQRGRLILEH